jgi:hypothetical protein
MQRSLPIWYGTSADTPLNTISETGVLSGLTQ